MMRHMPALLAWLVLLVCVGVIVVAHALLLSVPGGPPYAWVTVASFLAFPAIGALIIARRPKNTVGWIFCVIGLGTATTSFTAGYVQHAIAMHTDAQLPTGLVDVLGNAVWPLNIGLGSLLLFLFPDGKLPSRRWRPIFWLDIACIVAMIVTGALHPGPLEAQGRVVNPISIPGAGPLLDTLNTIAQTLFLFIVLAAIMSVIVRYRHAAGPQRQQIKWFAYGAAMIAFVAVGTVVLASAVSPNGQDPSNSLISYVGFSIGYLMLPIGAGIGVLRYRLYDIDIIINRTLVYGTLTATLAVVYFGCVVGFQMLAQALTGVKTLPPPAVVASTLLVAALVNPLRRRIQRLIDRRFYRKKYDAAKTLASLGARLRTETDLEDLRKHVLMVVDETMQPAKISLWLAPGERNPVRNELPETPVR